MTVFRKNVNTIGSHREAERLSAYSSFINTCKNLVHSIYGAFMALLAKQYDNANRDNESPLLAILVK